MPDGIIMLVKEEHLEKALPSMKETLLGIVKSQRAAQSEKAFQPIDFRPVGNETLSNEVQPWKRLSSIEVTPVGIITVFSAEH